MKNPVCNIFITLTATSMVFLIGCFSMTAPKEKTQAKSSDIQTQSSYTWSAIQTEAVTEAVTSSDLSRVDTSEISSDSIENETNTRTGTETDIPEDVDVDTRIVLPPTDTEQHTDSSVNVETETIADSQTINPTDTSNSTETAIDSDTPEPVSCDVLLSALDGDLFDDNRLYLGEYPVEDALFSSRLDYIHLNQTDTTGIVRIPLTTNGETTLIFEEDPLAMSWLEPDVSLLVTSSSDPCCALNIVSAQTGKSEMIDDQVCVHLVSEDRRKLFVIRACEDGLGKLVAHDLETNENQLLSNMVVTNDIMFNLTVTPNGRYVAFTVSTAVHNHTPHVADSQEGTVQVIQESPAYGLQFIDNNNLLMQVSENEWDWYPDHVVYKPESGELIPIASMLYPAIGVEPYGYPLSPDRSYFLAAEIIQEGEGENRIYAVKTDGTGTVLLGENGAPFQGNALGFRHPFKINWDSTRALYVGDFYSSLISVSMDGTDRNVLSETLHYLGWAPSPYSNHVCFLEDTESVSAPFDVRITNLDTLESFSIGETQSMWLENAEFTPSGKGIMYIQSHDEGLHALRHHSLADGTSTVIGNWSEQQGAQFILDPIGCVVLYNTDLGTAPGAYLKLLPFN